MKSKTLFFPHTYFSAQYMLRVLWPARELDKNGEKVRVISPERDRTKLWDDDQFEKDMVWADNIVVQMPGTKLALRIADFCNETGKKFIADFDDNPLMVTPDNPAYAQFAEKDVGDKWKAGITYNPRRSSLNTSLYKACISMADAITVTNTFLADSFKGMTDAEIWVLPNMLKLDWYKKWNLPKSDEVRIGWQVSSSHAGDSDFLEDTLQKVVDKYNVKIVTLGDSFPAVETTNTERHRWVDTDTFYTKLGALNLDIGLCPLADNDFNRAKSNLKFLEYAACNVPSVCSSIPNGPFNELLPPYKDRVLVPNDKKLWYEMLEKLILDAQGRKTIGEAANATLRNVYDIEQGWGLWRDCYNSIHENLVVAPTAHTRRILNTGGNT